MQFYYYGFLCAANDKELYFNRNFIVFILNLPSEVEIVQFQCQSFLLLLAVHAGKDVRQIFLIKFTFCSSVHVGFVRFNVFMLLSRWHSRNLYASYRFRWHQPFKLSCIQGACTTVVTLQCAMSYKLKVEKIIFCSFLYTVVLFMLMLSVVQLPLVILKSVYVCGSLQCNGECIPLTSRRMG